MSDDKAERIRSKISASQARSQGKAEARKPAPKPKAKRVSPDRRGFVDKALDDHPLALLAGSMVLGAIAASLMPAAWGRKLGGRLLGAAALAGELGALYGGKALSAAAEGARAGQDRLEDLGETIADQSVDARRKAVELGTLAGRRAVELAGSAARNARDSGGGAIRALTDLADRVRH